MIDLKYAKNEKFKNHIATFTDYGKIKILDFKNPETIDYHIRFLFDEEYYTLHISGDLGELTASNYNNMTYGKFSDFVNNIPYFKKKIDCHSESFFEYDIDIARKDIAKIFEECCIPDDTSEDVIDKILEDFENFGIVYGSNGYNILESADCDILEYYEKIGRKSSGILELYMLAFTLAQKQLKERSQ